jgi:LDH2 family malate/lactate/ureidoglycolate dehydrogenase
VTKNSARVDFADLEQVVIKLFEYRGVPSEDAEIVARHLVRADARGVHSHGVLRLNFYLAKLDSGTLNPATVLTPKQETPLLKRYTANNGIGQVVATQAMGIAIAAAADNGIGIVLVSESNHFGIAQLHTLLAAEAGFIGITLSNASPAFAPTGGITKLIGNNPWSVAVPSEGPFPIIIDMANTVVARGKVLTALEEGRAIPEGWALDKTGKPTTDPAAALQGTMLPLGGHKGYAIAVAIELLTGALSDGGSFDQVVYPGVPDRISNVSHLFIAIDPAMLGPFGYPERVSSVIKRIKEVECSPGVAEIYLPGEQEARREAESRKNGVLLPPRILDVVSKQAQHASIELPW